MVISEDIFGCKSRKIKSRVSEKGMKSDFVNETLRETSRLIRFDEFSFRRSMKYRDRFYRFKYHTNHDSYSFGGMKLQLGDNI
jgi:hypothetical protein